MLAVSSKLEEAGPVTPQTTVRFAVVADDGRRSAEWRLWTGKGKPTDETYLAPRSRAGEMKVSLHASGYAQHGLTGPARDRLRAGDKHAFDRWETSSAVAAGVTLAYVLRFYERELRRVGGLRRDSVAVPAGVDDGRIVLGIYISERRTTDADRRSLGTSVYATLPRACGGEVLLAGSNLPPDTDGYARDLAELRGQTVGHPGWDWATRPLKSDGFGWMHGESESTGVRVALELSSETIVRIFEEGSALHDDRFASLQHYRDLPGDIRPDIAVCGVLVVPQIGLPMLYFDDRARCDFVALKDDAIALTHSLRTLGPDAGWFLDRDGRYVTGLTTEAPHQH